MDRPSTNNIIHFIEHSTFSPRFLSFKSKDINLYSFDKKKKKMFKSFLVPT